MVKIYKYILTFSVVALLVFYGRFGSLSCAKYTEFDLEKKKLLDQGFLEKDIYYVADDFDSYGNMYSRSIDQMEDMENITLFGKARDLKMSSDHYGKDKSISFIIYDNDANTSAGIRRNFEQPLNLSRWDNRGYFTSWLKLDSRTGILGLYLKIGDNNGNYRLFDELPNLQVDDPDIVQADDIYPDLQYIYNKEGINKWQDFRLINGWNYLFWRADLGHFNDTGNVDLYNITWYEIVINVSNSSSGQNINLDNLRVQDGLQRYDNPTNGSWYSPNGIPQYGIFDIDETVEGSKDFKIRLLNVRQSQYASNGDHGRILSKKAMPLNFTAQIYFKLVDLPQRWRGNIFNYSSNRNNTWFRVQYDFDNEYDPGHDWFGTFISLEHEKFGLTSTFPVVRYLIQRQEPIEFTKESRVDISIKKDTLYILDIKALGQYENAIIYEVNNGCISEIGNIEYVFKRQRYGYNKRYPLSIEVTGNVHADIYSVHVISFDDVHR